MSALAFGLVIVTVGVGTVTARAADRYVPNWLVARTRSVCCPGPIVEGLKVSG